MATDGRRRGRGKDGASSEGEGGEYGRGEFRSGPEVKTALVALQTGGHVGRVEVGLSRSEHGFGIVMKWLDGTKECGCLH